MYEPNNTSLATTMETGFILPMMADSDFSAEDLAEDTFGMQINFTRIKIPSGGGLAFEVPKADSNRPEITQTLQGIILYHHPMNNYWPSGKDDENSPPSCSSVDGISGVGNPGTICKDCPHNQWGTGKEGSGKACKNGFNLYLLRSGEYLPVQVQLPPTSIKPFIDFVTSFTKRMRAVFGSLIEIGLRKETNPGGKDYSVATFSLISDFYGPELKNVIECTKSMKSQIKAMADHRVSSMLDRHYSAEPSQPYYDGGYPYYQDPPPAYDEGSFREIGDDEELPFK